MITDFFFFACAPGCVGIFILAFIPSFIWLVFFWLQDKHRESKGIIMRIFFWGFFIAIPIVLAETIAENYLGTFFAELSLFWLFGFLAIALVEEAGKYLVVYAKAIPLRAFNEPQDAIIYMITAALGFAAIENFFYALNVYENGFSASLLSLGGRFLTATPLHVIASGIFGYFLALSLFSPKPRHGLIVLGLVIATALHGFYNHFIIQAGEISQIRNLPFISILILIQGGAVLLVLYWHLRSRPPTADNIKN